MIMRKSCIALFLILVFFSLSSIAHAQKATGYKFIRNLQKSISLRAGPTAQLEVNTRGGQSDLVIKYSRDCTEKIVFKWKFDRDISYLRINEEFTVTTSVWVQNSCGDDRAPFARAGNDWTSTFANQLSVEESNAKKLTLVSSTEKGERRIYGKPGRPPGIERFKVTLGGQSDYKYNYFNMDLNYNTWEEGYIHEIAYLFEAAYGEPPTEGDPPVPPVPGDNRCEEYARTAVAQNGENERLKCGFTGNRWTNDYQGHLNWCKGVAQENADRETQARKDQLDECRKRKKRCEDYARTAVEQNGENIRLKCGYTGRRWSSDSQGHLDWCMGVSQESSDNETKARDKELEECRKRGDGPRERTLVADRRITRQGQSVAVPVSLLNPDGVANMNYTVTYNANVVVPDGQVMKGSLLRGIRMESNNAQAGFIRIGFAGKSGLSSDGDVADLPFRAVGKPGDRTPLVLRVTDIDDPAGNDLPIRTINGEIIIAQVGPPVGEPPVGEPPVGEPPVGEPPVGEPPVGEPPVGEPPVGEPPVGEPPVGEPPVGEPPVGEPPEPQVVKGDCNGNGVLDITDAICALRISVGLPVPLREEDYIDIMDVTGDMQVTSGDARAIMQRIP